MRRSVVLVLMGVACSGSTATVGSPDDGGVPPSDGAAADGAASDAPNASDVSSSEGSASDARDEVTACGACKPDFCGCGQCTAPQVVCTKTPKPCPLGCASACDLSQYACACEADRCVRTTPPPGDAVPCYTTFDCPPGSCCQTRSGPLQGLCVPGDSCP